MEEKGELWRDDDAVRGGKKKRETLKGEEDAEEGIYGCGGKDE